LFKDVFDLDLTHPSFMAFNTEQAQNGTLLYNPTLTIIFLSQLQDEHPAALDDAEV
jgi:hypothetical protein